MKVVIPVEQARVDSPISSIFGRSPFFTFLILKPIKVLFWNLPFFWAECRHSGCPTDD